MDRRLLSALVLFGPLATSCLPPEPACPRTEVPTPTEEFYAGVMEVENEPPLPEYAEFVIHELRMYVGVRFQISVIDSCQNSHGLCVRFDDTLPTDRTGEFRPSANLISLHPDRVRPHTLEHEVLHSLGLGHSEDKCSIMYKGGSGPTYTLEIQSDLINERTEP